MPEIPIDLTDLIDRHCALEIEALAALSPSIDADALPRWMDAQERTPYWLNRIVTFAPEESYDEDVGEEGTLEIVTVEMQLIYAPTSAGVEGESEAGMLRALPQVIAYFRRRPWLQSSSFLEPMPYLQRAAVTLASGATPLPPTPDGTQRVGMLFRSECRFITPIDLEYAGDVP